MNIHSENFEVYFKVPFYKRKIVKELKLWWNPDKKQWFKRFKACDYDLSEFQQSEFDIGKLIDSQIDPKYKVLDRAFGLGAGKRKRGRPRKNKA